ncbi:MAG TPA: phosphatidylglycerophosphatase A [Pyrinomonadaceae bacterium]|nr:phosphatidylglycerophosphatase A [Pyrinomonadaceae bacterium]
MKVVKDSSDELNPPVPTRAEIAPARRRQAGRDYVALTIATCGVGYMPLAPGTWGSALGVGIYMLMRTASGSLLNTASVRGWELTLFESLRTTFELLLLIVIIIVGIWAASRAEPLLGRKDPGTVVIDEVAGQLITFLFVPWNAGWWAVVAGFLTFRLFDIWKPYPIRRLESLESGLGVMADDVLAGAYAATLMSILTSVYLII